MLGTGRGEVTRGREDGKQGPCLVHWQVSPCGGVEANLSQPPPSCHTRSLIPDPPVVDCQSLCAGDAPSSDKVWEVQS